MQKLMGKRQIIGFLFTILLGTLLHFLFDWTGENPAVALISAVNESTWEHMKLLFYPLLLFAILERVLWKNRSKNFWAVKLSGILLGLLMIPLLFYTYTGILGKSVDFINIAIFYLTAAAVFLLETRWFRKGKALPVYENTALLVLGLLVIAFTMFTFYPPKLPLFRDPLTGTHGFFKKR